MTQVASPATVLGDFNNVTLEVDGERFFLQRRGAEFWVEMVDPDWKHDQAKARAGWPGYSLADPSKAPRIWKRIGMITDGQIRVTGREYNGLVETVCHTRGNLSCLSCHSIHQSDPNDHLASGMDGNRACLQCHEKIGHNLTSHTHHAPGPTGSQCYNCHMPYATYGLLKAVRNHYIDSPSV